MKKIERISISRILFDFIKADRIIDAGEMNQYATLKEHYAISKEDEIAATRMTFADAVNVLSKSEKGLIMDFVGDCSDMTLSDGFCDRSEALLLLALRCKLTSDYDDVEILSIPKSLFNITASSILYVESRTEPEINKIIIENYRSLYKECQLAGFNFIYIPKVIEHYKNTDRELTNQIISFLAPSFADEGVNTVVDGLFSMTTTSFCKDILCNKLGITSLRSTSPSLLIKIGESYVGDNIFSNYFKIEIDAEIVVTLQRMLDDFLSMISADIITISKAEEKKNQFLYHGFYKQLLDIFMMRKNVRSRVVINPYTEEISFPDIDSKLEKLHRREKALYILILILTYEGGVNFNPPTSGKQLERYYAKMNAIQERYQIIYELFGGEKDKAPDLIQPEIRRPIISCLKKSLNLLKDTLYNSEDYMITKDEFGNLRVGLEQDLQYIHSGINGIIRLADSDIFKKITKVSSPLSLNKQK